MSYSSIWKHNKPVGTTSGELHKALDKFLENATTESQDIETLEAYLTECPSFSDLKDLIPIEEVEHRLEMIRKIEYKIQDECLGWRLMAIYLSIMMTMPLDGFKAMLWNPRLFMPKVLDRMVYIVCHFFQRLAKDKKAELAGLPVITPPLGVFGEIADDTPGSSSQQQKQDVEPTTEGKGKPEPRDETCIPDRKTDGSISRDENEEKVCLERDNHVCLVTGTAYPQACHIVPSPLMIPMRTWRSRVMSLITPVASFILPSRRIFVRSLHVSLVAQTPLGKCSP